MPEAVIAIGNAEPGGRDAELTVFGGDSDVGQHRHLHAAAEAEAADAGDGRFGIVGQQRALRGAPPGILLRGFGVVSGLLELADVGARDERLVPGADQDHDTHIGMLAQFAQGEAEAFPHVERDGVALGGIVEGHDADAVGDTLQDLAVGKGSIGLVGNIWHRRDFRLGGDLRR